MNAYKISIIIFLIIIALVIANSIAVTAMTDTLLDLIDTPDEFADKWHKCRLLLSITLNEDLLHSIDNALTMMNAYSQTDEPAEYAAAKNQLRLSVERIHRLESVTLENII